MVISFFCCTFAAANEIKTEYQNITIELLKQQVSSSTLEEPSRERLSIGKLARESKGSEVKVK